MIKRFEEYSKFIKLYRGDSTYIDEFIYDKFEETAIYGPGLYLTDNKDIAYTYTLKGDKTPVVSELFPSSDDIKDVELNFIILNLLNKVNNTNFKEHELYNLYEILKDENSDIIKRYKEGIELFWLNDEYIKTLSEDEYKEQLNDNFWKDNIKNKIKNINNIHTKFDKYLDKAKKEFNNIKHNLKFLQSSDIEWEVVDIDINKGSISEFLVKSDIIDNVYDANQKITDEVDKILKSVSRRYSNRIKEDKKISFKDLKDNAVYGEQEYSLSNFFYNNKILRDKNLHLNSDEWYSFINKMQSLGYKGIKYNGGEHLKYPIKHKAYVIWDMKDVERIN